MTLPEAGFDPTGMAEQGADTTLAPRPAELRGLTVGLLDNTKANASLLLSGIAGELTRRHGVGGSRMYVKDYFGTPAPPELIEKIAQDCDFVITAIGDCGSCSAATVADGIFFERAGIPAVSICSGSFTASGRAMAEVHGFPGYEFVTVRHPVASLDAARIAERVREALPQVLRILGVAAA
jgi:hypothetical protein